MNIVTSVVGTNHSQTKIEHGVGFSTFLSFARPFNLFDIGAVFEIMIVAVSVGIRSGRQKKRKLKKKSTCLIRSVLNHCYSYCTISRSKKNVGNLKKRFPPRLTIDWLIRQKTLGLIRVTQEVALILFENGLYVCFLCWRSRCLLTIRLTSIDGFLRGISYT